MLITIEFDSDVPIYLQLRNQIVMAIGEGTLKIGEGLPTVRQLAEDIGVNAMTVNKAYGILKNEGFISIDRRHGATIKPAYEGRAEYREKLEKNLTLVVSEACLRGIDKSAFMDICNKVYGRMAGLNDNPLTEQGGTL